MFENFAEMMFVMGLVAPPCAVILAGLLLLPRSQRRQTARAVNQTPAHV